MVLREGAPAGGPDAAGQGNRWKRLDALDERRVNLDGFVDEQPAIGFAAMHSPHDPPPSLQLEGGVVAELDGTPRAAFDLIDQFIADHSIDRAVAEEAMATDSLVFARRLVDIDTPRAELVRLAGGMTPAKVAEVLNHLNVVELMMAIQKMRARRTPSIQAHVTNRQDDPAQLAADAATAALMGFREVETTMPVARDAASNALAVLVGSQVGAGGVLTQCSIEEAIELDLGLRGLTSYAETVSVYGTEPVFVDGDDTPWSKAFLGTAYASRGIKMRFTSGAGAEVLMGHAEGKSMLYLEARCVAMTRGAGIQGVQNGGIDGVCIAGAVIGGVRELLAENLLVMLWDLESVTGNDSQFSESDMRRAARTLPYLLAGTDFIFSGYGSIPGYDNMFGPSNFNAEDTDDYLVLQRDFEVDGGLRTLDEDEALAIRRRAARAVQAVFDELDLPGISDEAVEAVVVAHGSRDTLPRAGVDNLRAADTILRRGITGLDVVRALARRGFEPEARNVLRMLTQRVAGDYLQTSAIFDRDYRLRAAINDPNDYRGPGTGYRLVGERRAEVAHIRQALRPEDLAGVASQAADGGPTLRAVGTATPGVAADEVVVGVAPAFAATLHRTINGLPVALVLQEILAGIEEEGLRGRAVRIMHTADVAFVGLAAARLSGSGIGIGLQSKGTTVIHHRALRPLDNLELFPVAPLMTPALYRAVGRNAARYAKGEQPEPVKTPYITEAIEARYHARAAMLYQAEVAQIRSGDPPIELEVTYA